MTLISDIVLWALAIFSAAVAAVFIWIESQPDAEIEGAIGHYDYSSGQKVEEWVVKVRLGRIPFLNKHLVKKKMLASVPSPHTIVLPHLVKGSYPEEIDTEKDWFEYSYSDGEEEQLLIYLKRECVQQLKMHAKIMFRITQPVDSSKFGSIVKREESSSGTATGTIIRVKLENISKLQINNFEFVYPLPKANTVKLIEVVKVDNTKRPLAYSPADFLVRHEDYLVTGSFPTGGVQSGSNLLVGTITLEPGLTEITFEYT